MQLVCRTPELSRIRQTLRAFFPDAVLREESGMLEARWIESPDSWRTVVEFGLSHEFMLPLRPHDDLAVDPLIGIAAALSDLEQGEMAVLQVLFQQTREPWAESAIRSVSDGVGGSFFIDAPETLNLAKKKMSRPLFAAVVRVATKGPSSSRVAEILRAVGGSFGQVSNPGSNALMPLDNDGYLPETHEEDFLLRQSRRSGMILNVDELAALVHPPAASVRVEKLARQAKRTKAAPPIAIGHALTLGENSHNGQVVTVGLTTTQRLRHTYLIGASGTGKSTLLLNMIVQDLRNGEGFAVLDPHGDLIDWILGHIPDERIQDVLLLDPSDEEYPIGFNILSARSEVEKNLLASDLVAVFRRLSTSWGDQMTSVLGNAILAFLESSKGGTLADLRRFLVEVDFRESFLGTVKDPDVVYYWQREFPLLTGRPQAPLLTRLDTFLRPKIIRNMVTQKEDKLDFRQMMDGKKILLAKLAQGSIGEENAYLLGTLLVAKLHQMALGRQNVPEEKRQPFTVYIDEFHNFITPSLAAILSGARKFGMGLVLSHQELRQISALSPEVASAVIANPCTRICFRLGDEDAKKLANGFSSFTAQDLQSLGTGEAIVRIERSEYDFTLKTLPLPTIDPATADERRRKIVDVSREQFSRRRDDVEKAQRQQTPQSLPAKKTRPPKRFAPPPRAGKTRVAETTHAPPNGVGANGRDNGQGSH
jgi:hypothetical protein